ncbi:MAG TPA: hypothetical protein VMD27_09395 [Candidatus Aquilonibacter sp.]|nr:hypothetical protein [Candidatus Aquilonibacter sp.]
MKFQPSKWQDFCGLKLVRVFEQAAEILFAGDDFPAVPAGKAGH